MTNRDLSLRVFSFLKKAGVRSVVVCAGARNAPLVLALEKQDFKIYTYFEERSAAFFALGLIKSGKTPTAVFTTSGTAVAELLPAAIEATYQCLPLIIVSADRPKKYRGTGAPQTIEQPGLFTAFVESSIELDVQSSEFDFKWSGKKPVHLNVCFDEPLLDKASPGTHEVKLALTANPAPQLKSVSSMPQPLIILGEFDVKSRDRVREFIKKTRAPVYAESQSNLKNDKSIAEFLLFSSDQIVQNIFRHKLCHSIIRIGSVPTLRFWRDLESEFSEIPVLNYTDSGYSGLSRTSGVLAVDQLRFSSEFPSKIMAEIKETDERFQIEKKILLDRYPQSEQSLCFTFSKSVGNDPVYVGNSLPIRHWDQFALSDSSVVAANRGANGIDGQVSTFLGWSEVFKSSYCLLGDLTAMYDLVALGLTPQLQQNRRKLAIINNFGGQIFNRVFKNADFINAHDRQFFHWSQMWGWDYLKITNPDGFTEMQKFSGENLLVEIVPVAAETEKFWAEWDLLWQKH